MRVLRFDTALLLLTCTILSVAIAVAGNLNAPKQLTAEDKEALLQACYNQHYNGTPSTFEDFLRGFNTSLFLHKVYWSAKQPQLPLTIFVSATLERLDALDAQCRCYPGPLSAAVYVPLLQQQHGSKLTPENSAALLAAANRVQALFESLEAPSRSPSCALTALLLYEAVSDPPLARLLPVNSLRNAALLPVATPLAAMVDVDLATSAGLAGEVLAPGAGLREILRTCDKATLRTLSADSRLHPFAHYAYRRGHAATNFSRWLASDEPYDVPYEINYEPWDLLPPYDVRFRGYGWNKVAQVAHVAALNFTFRVAPGAWLVHRPHERSAGQRLYGAAAAGQGQGQADEVRTWKGSRAPLSRLFHRRVSALRHVAVRDMRRGTYVAAEDPQSAGCRAELPWWRPGGGSL
ncbi:hypothetical protein GPECTOR_3g356 [Gonium pectorale]|uniref:Uncharacterized protein n=1 Tax=Gonium pectorale TaxID=33097 RepID=A0A150GZN3_GONPE|nr:hypothetical protein GPECTOR_3g356 [Gonium pectorale]|eukprot:KXZ55213.1 hypothetical protein GPECTOR_3g356 [Gonium pectorale]